MKAIFKHALTLLGLTSIFAFTGCQDEDFGYSSEDVKKGAFSRNFENEYGEIDPEQSWDLYGSLPRISKFDPWTHGDAMTRTVPDALLCDASDVIKDNGNVWYEVDPATLMWLNENLTEKNNNTRMGEPFSLLPPAKNDFAIFPIYQGKAGMDWDLHMVVGNKDYKIWSESQGIQKKINATGDWQDLGTTYDDSYTIGAYAVRGARILFDKNKINEPFYFYLDITAGQTKADGGDGDYAKTGTAQRSDEGMMLALGCPIPSNIGATNVNGADIKNHVMIIGCEDSDMADSDWDMNDVVFMMVGYPYVPDIVEYTRKRYLIEDLGNTWDFDFNDIVVDVDQEVVKQATIADDGSSIVFVEDNSKRKQYATIRYLCGTLPFQVVVGDTEFPAVSSPTNHAQTLTQLGESAPRGGNEETTESIGWNPNVTKEITGWNSFENNIKILVSSTEWSTKETVFTKPFSKYAEDNDGHAYSIDFPGPGKTPLIIATDQTVQWMNESVHIPTEWWQTTKLFGYDLILKCSPEAAGSVQGTGNYEQNAKISIFAKAVSGYVFEKWNDDVTDNPRSITMDSNKELTAIFREATHVEVLWSATEGCSAQISAMVNGQDVTSGDTFLEGTSIRLFAETTDPNKEFVNWTIGETSVSEAADFFYRIRAEESSSVSLVANFASAWYDVEVPQDEDGGNIIWSGSVGNDWYKEFRDVTDKSDSHKRLVKSLKQGYMYLKIEFNPSFNGSLTLRCADWNTVILDNETISNKGYYILALTDEMAQNLIDKGGLIAVMQASGSTDYALTKIKAYTESPVTSFTISVEAETGGTASANKTSAESGEQVTLTATANTGYIFLGWKNTDGTIKSTQNPWTFSVTSNVNYTASFAEAAKYDVTITPGANGKIRVDGTEYAAAFTAADVYEGTEYVVEAIPNVGYDFDSWSNGGSVSQTITVNRNVDITANFKIKTFTLTLQATDGGKYRINDGELVTSYTNTYNYGSEVKVEAVSDDEDAYAFAGWNDGVAEATRIFTMTENKTVKAKFSAAGAVTITNQNITIGGNNGSYKLTSGQVTAIENAFSEGKTTIAITFSKMSGDTELHLKTEWYNDVVVFDIKANDESASIQLTQANIDKIKAENNLIQFVNSGSDITITSISMQ